MGSSNHRARGTKSFFYRRNCGGLRLGTFGCCSRALKMLRANPYCLSVLNHPLCDIFCSDTQVRERVAPEPTAEAPGSGPEAYIKNVIAIYENQTDFKVVDVDPGQPFIEINGVWRTHSTFHPQTGRRRSSDTLLDRGNPNLVVRTDSKVSSILFDGDSGIPTTAAAAKATATPRARCVRLVSREVFCVKDQGRIYLSAGAIHTPDLLIRSGIGPNGTKFDNPNVRVAVTLDAFRSML